MINCKFIHRYWYLVLSHFHKKELHHLNRSISTVKIVKWGGGRADSIWLLRVSWGHRWTWIWDVRGADRAPETKSRKTCSRELAKLRIKPCSSCVRSFCSAVGELRCGRLHWATGSWLFLVSEGYPAQPKHRRIEMKMLM